MWLTGFSNYATDFGTLTELRQGSRLRRIFYERHMDDRLPFFEFIEDKEGTWWGIMVMEEFDNEADAAEWFEGIIDRDIAVVELETDVVTH